jgi:sulfoxide reductase heme-binding subunit YedZ
MVLERTAAERRTATRPARRPAGRGLVAIGRFRFHWLPVLVHAGAILSLAWLAWSVGSGAFVVDPVREITSYTGKAALVLLVLSLACTPLHILLGWKPVGRVRRSLGLYSFGYAGLHFLTYVGLDYRFDWPLLWQALGQDRYVLVGIGAGLILLALALTSTQGWQKRLRRNWKRLHRLVYLAGILAVVHFLWLVKDPQEPLRYAALLAVLLILRLPPVRKAASRLRCRLAALLSRAFQALTGPKPVEKG